jgi:hypothetical protein
MVVVTVKNHPVSLREHLGSNHPELLPTRPQFITMPFSYSSELTRPVHGIKEVRP